MTSPLDINNRSTPASAAAPSTSSPTPIPPTEFDASIPLNRLPASAVLPRLREGEVKVLDVLRAHLERLAERDAEVGAWAYMDQGRAMAEAERLDRLDPEDRGPLHGLILGVKDLIDTKDMPTAYGSAIYAGSQPGVDATLVAVLRQAGALVYGKTHTTEFAFSTVGPPTHNPHDLTRTPGGSSSGSAAAVADYQCHMAIGTQTGGSMIRPASFCGVYGYKATWSAFPRDGIKITSLTLDTPGFYARSLDDFGLLLPVFGIPTDPSVPQSLPASPNASSAFSSPPPIEKCRFAFIKTDVWDLAPGPSPELQAAWAEARASLVAAGAHVDDVDLPPEFDGLAKDANPKVLYGEVQTNLLPEYVAGRAQLADMIQDAVVNARQYTKRDFLEAYDRFSRCRPVFDALASKYDAVVTPSVLGEAPVGLGYTGDSRFNAMWTGLHVPTVNIPAFRGPNGMPLGLTLTAPRFEDARLLSVAKAVAAIWLKGKWS